jgi:hypothetical protein
MNWLWFFIGIVTGILFVIGLAILVFSAEESRREGEREARLAGKAWGPGE